MIQLCQTVCVTMNQFLNWVFIMFILMSPFLVTAVVKSSFILGVEFTLGMQLG